MIRFFEILPALLAWSTILAPLFFSNTFPIAVSLFVLLYIFLWFLRAMEYAFFLVFSFREYKKALQKNWMAEARKVDKKTDLKTDEMIHLIILPTYKEDISILRESIQSIVDSDFDRQRIWLCLATEERDSKRGRTNATLLRKEFSGQLGRFFWTEHPKNIPGEVIGKGGNITFAAKKVAQKLSEEHRDVRHILTTTLDADNKLHPSLLIALAVAFCRDPKRHHRAFQPIPLFFNNIWEVPIINRIVAISSGFWHLIESGRPDRLRNFSSHSQPLSALIEMDFWDTGTIVEDGRQYWRSYLHFNGEYEVVPIFLPIYQDAVLGKNYAHSLVGQFHQMRRWAWGASDIGYFLRGIWQQRKTIPLRRSFLQLFRLIEGHYMWATTAMFLTISSISARFLTPDFYDSIFGAHFLFILDTIFKIALSGIVISIVLTFLMTPPPPKKISRFSLLWQWIFLPITTICFGCWPALFTQTQMAFGKKMTFNVTEKNRVKRTAKH